MQHPLATLTLQDGFRLKDAPVIKADFTVTPMQLPPPGSLTPFRERVPYTQGRALDWKLIQNLQAARARNWPTFKPFEFHGQQIAICGGGPSLGPTLHNLRTLYKAGVKVMAINRTHDFLLDLPKTHSLPWIKPWAGILLEAIPHASKYMRPTGGVRYYISSQCDPSSFDAFEKSEHFIWHAQARKEMVDAMLPEERGHMVPAIGSTCGLRSIVLAYMMGFTAIHLFGFDSCYSTEDLKNGILGADGKPKLHSYKKPETIHDSMQIVVKGWDDGKDREYWGNSNMLAQADEFQGFLKWRDDNLKAKRIDPHSLIVHGTGLIPDIARGYGLHIENYLEKYKERNAA